MRYVSQPQRAANPRIHSGETNAPASDARYLPADRGDDSTPGADLWMRRGRQRLQYQHNLEGARPELLRPAAARDRAVAKWAGVRDLGAAIPLPRQGVHPADREHGSGRAVAAQDRQELASNVYGSSQQNINDLTTPVALAGKVGCGRPPVVLLAGLVPTPVHTAAFESGRRRWRFKLVGMPADLGVRGVVGYGFLTTDATLRMTSPRGKVVYSEALPGPPSHQECAGGTESIQYAFAPGR
jgi:hypothetical protein